MPKPRSNIMHRPILYVIMWIEGYCQHITVAYTHIYSQMLADIIHPIRFILAHNLTNSRSLPPRPPSYCSRHLSKSYPMGWLLSDSFQFTSKTPYKEPHNNSCALNSKIQIHISPWIIGPKRRPICQWKAYFQSIKLMKKRQRKSRVKTHFVTDACTLTQQQIERQRSKQHKSIKRSSPETAEVPIETSFYSVHDHVGVVWENRLAVSQ